MWSQGYIKRGMRWEAITWNGKLDIAVVHYRGEVKEATGLLRLYISLLARR